VVSLTEEHAGCGDKITLIETERNEAVDAHAGCEGAFAAAQEELTGFGDALAAAQVEHEGCEAKIAELEGERDAAVEAHAGCEEALAGA